MPTEQHNIQIGNDYNTLVTQESNSGMQKHLWGVQTFCRKTSKFCGIVLEIISENVNMRKFSQFLPQGFISVDLKLYKLLYDHTALTIFQLSITIENMSKDTGNTPHIRLQHFLQNKIANYSLINLNTSRQAKLSDNTSKHYLSRVTLACFAKTPERRFILLCFTTCQLFCILLEIHDYYNLLHFNNYTLFQGFLQTTLTLDDIFYSARQESMTTKIYFKNVLYGYHFKCTMFSQKIDKCD